MRDDFGCDKKFVVVNVLSSTGTNAVFYYSDVSIVFRLSELPGKATQKNVFPVT